MNINFDIDLSANAFEDYKKMNPKCDTIIDRFSGTKIRRHEFLIRFALAPTFRRWDLVHKIPLIEKLECLVGFEKLTVLVEVPADFLSGSDDSAVSDSEIRIITSDTEIRVMQRFMHGLLMKYISTLLSPSLGPCVPSSTFSENSKVSETCKLEFQPHKYHFDIIQAQAHRILLEEEIIEDGLLLLQRWTITP